MRKGVSKIGPKKTCIESGGVRPADAGVHARSKLARRNTRRRTGPAISQVPTKMKLLAQDYAPSNIRIQDLGAQQLPIWSPPARRMLGY